MALSKLKQVLASLSPLKWHQMSRAGLLEEKQEISQLVNGRRPSLLTQKQDLKDLLATCTSWDTTIHALPAIPKRKDRCWVFCSDLVSEAQGLKIELLKLQQDVAGLDLQENEIGILEEVVRFVDQQLVEMPSFDGILADGKLLARSNIRFWHCSRVRKHAWTFGAAARCFQAARGRVQDFRTSLAMDHAYWDVVTEGILEDRTVLAGSPSAIRPAEIKRDDGRMNRPWLLQRISTGLSRLSSSILQAVHPPEVDI